MEKIKALLIKYKELILYVIFGVLTTLVNWVTYALIEPPLKDAIQGDGTIFSLFGMNITYTTFAIFIANFIAWVAGVAFAFVTNKIWVFESKSWKPSVALKELWMFVAARLLTGVIEWVGVPLLTAMGLDQEIVLFGKTIEGFIAKIIVSVIVIILNYVFSKLFIFKDKDKEKKEP